jgi:hypothetical protein
VKLAPIEVTYLGPAQVHYDGSATIRLLGRTKNGTQHDVTILLRPFTVGTFGERLHTIAREQHKRLLSVMEKLRTGNPTL